MGIIATVFNHINKGLALQVDEECVHFGVSETVFFKYKYTIESEWEEKFNKKGKVVDMLTPHYWSEDTTMGQREFISHMLKKKNKEISILGKRIMRKFNNINKINCGKCGAENNTHHVWCVECNKRIRHQ